MEITYKFINNSEGIILDSFSMKLFFEVFKCSSGLSAIKHFPKNIGKIIKYEFLLLAGFRKLFKIKPSVNQKMLLSLLNILFPKIKFENIIKLEISIGNKTLSFKTANWVVLMGCIKSIIENNQYNINIENIGNKTVIDAGANIGVFSLFAVFMGAKKVYAFEPVSSTANLLLENIKMNNMQDRIIIVNKALGNKNYFDRISFDSAGDCCANIHRYKKMDFLKSEKVEIVRVDDFASDNKIKKIDFIKIDTEGFEENVLIGAKKIISKFKPILSLSAYHKLTDKKRLPEIIKFIRKDYKIDLNPNEDEFYCY